MRLRRPHLKEGVIVRVCPFRGYNGAQATLWLSAHFLINSPSPTFSIFLAFILYSLVFSLVHILRTSCISSCTSCTSCIPFVSTYFIYPSQFYAICVHSIRTHTYISDCCTLLFKTIISKF